MPVGEASSDETPYGRYIGSDGWFVLNLGDALAVRNEEKGGATYPLESREHPFRDVGVRVCVLWPGDPNALYHSEDAQEGFLVLSGECVWSSRTRSGSSGSGTTSTAQPARPMSWSARERGRARSSCSEPGPRPRRCATR